MALSREFSSRFVKTFGKVVKEKKTAIFSDIFTRHDDTHLQKSLTVSFPSCSPSVKQNNKKSNMRAKNGQQIKIIKGFLQTA